MQWAFGSGSGARAAATNKTSVVALMQVFTNTTLPSLPCCRRTPANSYHCFRLWPSNPLPRRRLPLPVPSCHCKVPSIVTCYMVDGWLCRGNGRSSLVPRRSAQWLLDPYKTRYKLTCMPISMQRGSQLISLNYEGLGAVSKNDRKHIQPYECRSPLPHRAPPLMVSQDDCPPD